MSLAEDIIPVEIIFLRMGTQQLQELQAVWPRINEQAFPLEMRKRLDRNGIRTAIVDTVVPLPLQTMIESVEKRLQDDPLEQAGVGADVRSHSRLLQCRNGQRKEITVRPTKTGTMVILHNEDGAAKGSCYEDPLLLLDFRVYPKDDGSVAVHITPEIQHGQPKLKIVGQEFALRREMKRESATWPDLTIEQSMIPGQIMLVTASTPPRGLGEHYFYTETATGEVEQLLFLVRIGPSKLDSAFVKSAR
ncbi:MAG: hypothetical protein SGI77_07540 [Pirellulaceae bacterium]|nr:hypothetical protein [Pirellulaceae bacterium]